jgi:K+-sensing histidine kinase KdpD
MLRGSVLACALLFSTPILWQALVDQTVSADAAVIRFLIAIPVAAVLLGFVRAAMKRTDGTPGSRRRVHRRPSGG